MSSRITSLKRAVGFCVVCVVAAACAGLPQHARSEHLGSYPDRDLDFVAKSIDQFGTVSVSGTTLIEPDPDFLLDLELSGKEIFERNRIEGFSALRQYDSMDLQVSTIAEVTQNMLGQMDGATDPNVKAELRQKVLGAAMQGIIATMPPEKQALFQKLLDNLQSGGEAGVGGGAVSDGGQGKLREMEDDLNDADEAIAEAAAAPAKIAEEKEEKGKKALASGALDALLRAVDEHKELLADAEAAVQAASALLGDAAKRAAAPDELGNAAVETALRDEIEAARQALIGVQDGVTHLLPPVRDRKTEFSDIPDKVDDMIAAVDSRVQKAKEDYSSAAPKNMVELLTAARDAVSKTIGVARYAGAPVAPPQRLLEAPDITERLAREQMPGWAAALENYQGGLNQNLQQLFVNVAADKSTLEMLRWLSYPHNYGPGKRVFMCMSTVNCTPGRDTYRGYSGQVDVYVEYGRKMGSDANAPFVRLPGKSPIAVSVYPLINTQLLDLRTSRRQMIGMAFQAIVNGYPAAGKMLLDYARQREQDIETLTGNNSFTSYSNGTHFGFTFAPRLVAQDDPSRLNSRPGMILQPQTLPVVIMIACDEQSLCRDDNPDGASHLIWYQTYRWLRAGSPRLDRIPGASWISRMRNPRLDEVEMASRAAALDEAANGLTQSRWLSVRDTVIGGLDQAMVLLQAPEHQTGLGAQEKSVERIVVQELAGLRQLAVAVPSDTDFQKIFQDLRNGVERNRKNLGRLQPEKASDLESSKNVHRTLAIDALSRTLDNLVPELYRPATFTQQLLQARLNSLAGMGIGTNIYFKLPLYGTDGGGGTFGVQRLTAASENRGDSMVTPPAVAENLRESLVDAAFVGLMDELPAAPTTITVSPTQGWLNAPTTVFLDSSNPVFDQDFVVSVGGRQVNAYRISGTVAKAVIPAWFRTEQIASAVAAGKGGPQGSASPKDSSGDRKDILPAAVTVATPAGVFECRPALNFVYQAPGVAHPDVTGDDVEDVGGRTGGEPGTDGEEPDTGGGSTE